MDWLVLIIFARNDFKFATVKSVFRRKKRRAGNANKSAISCLDICECDYQLEMKKMLGKNNVNISGGLDLIEISPQLQKLPTELPTNKTSKDRKATSPSFPHHNQPLPCSDLASECDELEIPLINSLF